MSVLPESEIRPEPTPNDSISVPSAARSSITPLVPSATGSENVTTRLSYVLASVPPLAGATTVTLGGAVSTTMATLLDIGETLPAASRAVALKLWAPSESGVEGVKLQLPLPLAVTVPSRVVPS